MLTPAKSHVSAELQCTLTIQAQEGTDTTPLRFVPQVTGHTGQRSVPRPLFLANNMQSTAKSALLHVEESHLHKMELVH